MYVTSGHDTEIRLTERMAAMWQEGIAKLEQAVQANEGIKEALRSTGDLLAGFNETFSRRAEVIQNAS